MQILKNPNRDRKSHQLTVHNALQSPAIANVLQHVKLVPCLPSVAIESGDAPIKYENFYLKLEQVPGIPLSPLYSKLAPFSGAPAEGFLHPMTEDKMVTNVDARTNVRLHYNQQIIKYEFHDPVSDFDIIPPSVGFTHMAHSHKKTKAIRWAHDFLGKLQ